MALFRFRKKEEKKPAELELPPLPPEQFTPVQEPSRLVSEVEHVRPGGEKPAVQEVLPEQPKPEAPRPQVQQRQQPRPVIKKFHAPKPKKKFELPEFPEEKSKELPEFPEFERTFLKAESELGKEALVREQRTLPVFVDVDDFKKLLDDINHMKTILNDSREGFKTIETLRVEQDKSLDSWKTELEDLQRKFIFIDRTLFEKRIV